MQPIGLQNQSAGIGDKGAPLLGEIYPPARPVKKIKAQLALHLPNTRRQGRLRHVQGMGSLGEGSQFRDLQERFERRRLEIHNRSRNLLIRPLSISIFD